MQAIKTTKYFIFKQIYQEKKYLKMKEPTMAGFSIRVRNRSYVKLNVVNGWTNMKAVRT
jgi:hypothetical protein